MGKITIDQSHQVMAALATNANWTDIDFDLSSLQDAIVRDPKGAGQRFTNFLRNGCRFIFGDPKSITTKPFDPASFLSKDWAIWRGPADGDGLSGEEDIDPRGLALTEIDVSKLRFETNLKKGEKSIKGEEKLRRQKEIANLIRLGGNTFLGLLEDYRANKENSILEWIYRTYKITFLDFMGQVLRYPYGYRYVLYLYRNDGGKWNWSYSWLDYGWNDDNPSACAQVTQDSVSQS